MPIYQESIDWLNKKFRLGENAAMPRDRVEALAIVVEKRIVALEKHAHPPVTFTEDENGFLRVTMINDSKDGSTS